MTVKAEVWSAVEIPGSAQLFVGLRATRVDLRINDVLIENLGFGADRIRRADDLGQRSSPEEAQEGRGVLGASDAASQTHLKFAPFGSSHDPARETLDALPPAPA